MPNAIKVVAAAMPLSRQAARTACKACAASSVSSSRYSSSFKRPPPNYPGHVPLSRIEQAAMAIGSSAMALFNPYRAGTCYAFHK